MRCKYSQMTTEMFKGDPKIEEPGCVKPWYSMKSELFADMYKL